MGMEIVAGCIFVLGINRPVDATLDEGKAVATALPAEPLSTVEKTAEEPGAKP